MRARKSSLVQELLPRLQLELPTQGFLELKSCFENPVQSYWLEVGFGGGEHLAAQAQQHPTIGFFGCEPFVNGIAGLLDHIERQHLTNIRVYPDDARHLLDVLPDACLEKCYVLFSDPWPKARHADRRFIGPYSLPRLSRVLKKDAELIMATDHPQLADHIRSHMNEAQAFARILDSHMAPEGWIPTRYEEKGVKAGRRPVYFCYRRI